MIASMTGFAATALTLERAQVSLDLRSVNQRYLEQHFRLADECRALEPRLRELIGRRLVRGKVECRIGVTPIVKTDSHTTLDAAALAQLGDWQARVREHLPDATRLSTHEALRWPGVLQGGNAAAVSDDAILAAAGELVEALYRSRLREGETLKAHLLARLASAEREIDSLRPLLPQLVAAQREKLAQRLTEALGEAAPERLAQELALFAQKVDVDEEISRLTAHIAEVRRVLDKGGAVGKRLDFLMQELHREANTLGSKSVSLETSRVSLELKVLIEQMREQVQNIE